MSIGLIWAQARDRVIGQDGTLPWHLPEDLAHFKATTTTGATVVMGRRTWESIPAKFRPLPGRTNVVVTSQPDWSDDGAVVAHSLEQAVRGPGDIWIIGGASIYEQAMELADRIVVTEIDESFDGDAYAPAIDERWTLSAAGDWLTSKTGLPYRLVEYRRS